MNKKVVTGLAIAAGLFLYAGNTSQVQAEGTCEQGVDLSKYQGNTAVFGSPKDTFAISQIGGYYQGYFIPQVTYKPQVSSTLAQGKRAHTYIYGEFNSTAQADQMLNYYLAKGSDTEGQYRSS
jgi:Glycosyl hydrolases family 25.